MKTTVSVVLFVYACSQISCQRSQYWERTPEQERAAVEFQFDGVSFSTTPADLQRQLPDAEISTSISDYPGMPGKVTFSWKPKNTARSAYAIFYDDRLLFMDIYYNVGDVERETAIRDKLIAKFGHPDDCASGGYKWHFQGKTHRIVSLSCDFDARRQPLMGEVRLYIMNTEVLQRQIDREKMEAAKMDTGL